MNLLGVDYGEKRIGLAVSSDENKMAFPYDVVENNKGVLEKIIKVCNERKIDKIIVGESLTYKNEPNPVMEKIEVFCKDLKKEMGIPVEMHNETLSTSEALRIQGRSDKTDASAAAIILNSYWSSCINHCRPLQYCKVGCNGLQPCNALQGLSYYLCIWLSPSI